MLNQSENAAGLSGALRRFNFEKVARSLVWVSLGLGLAELVAPKRIQKWVGIRRGDYTGLIRAVGAREVLSALLIMAQGRPRTGVWSRVAGDALDLGLLGAALSTPKVRKNQVARAAAVVAGAGALDLLTAAQLNRLHGESAQYSALTKKDLNHRSRGGAFHVRRSITILAQPAQVYQFWRNFENLPRFMYHLQQVQVLDDLRSQWTARAPAGANVSWIAEIVEDRPNERIAWRSMGDADVPNSGWVSFEQVPGGRETVVRVEIEYHPPGGAIGRAVAKLFGEEPAQQVAGDLRRLKQVIETGEVVISEGSPRGYGQKAQRPARPPADKNVGRQQPDWESERRQSGAERQPWTEQPGRGPRDFSERSSR